MKTTDEFLAEQIYGHDTGEPLRTRITLTWEKLILLLDKRGKEVQEAQILICEESAKVGIFRDDNGEMVEDSDKNSIYIEDSNGDEELEEVALFAEVVPKSILNCKRVI